MKQRSGEKIKMLSIDELLGIPTGEPVIDIDVDKIKDFESHPFKVMNDKKMQELVESILGNGILTPVIVRQDDDDGYEMISGHRRLFAAKEIGLEKIPAFVKDMTDDEAVIAMVDSNIQREEILPSEKAFAYKMRYEAMRHQGKKKFSSQFGTNLRSDDELAKEVGESRNQVHRYMRLTEVIPELLELIDLGKIAVMTGVDISYIDKKYQKWIFEYIKENGVIKSYQISALRNEISMSECAISQKQIINILNENQPGRKPAMRINFTSNQLRQYFPAYYSSQDARAVIESLLKQWKLEQDKIK